MKTLPRMMYRDLQRGKWLELVERLAAGPAVVTVEGQDRFVIMSLEEYERLALTVVPDAWKDVVDEPEPEESTYQWSGLVAGIYQPDGSIKFVPADADGNVIPW